MSAKFKTPIPMVLFWLDAFLRGGYSVKECEECLCLEMGMDISIHEWPSGELEVKVNYTNYSAVIHPADLPKYADDTLRRIQEQAKEVKVTLWDEGDTPNG